MASGSWATRPESLLPRWAAVTGPCREALTEGTGCGQCVERLRKGAPVPDEGLLYISQPNNFSGQ